MLCILPGCNQSSTQNSTIETIVFYAAKTKKYFDFASITDTSFQIIPLETTPDFLIGKIEKIDIKNNKIIIFDRMSRAVYLFNMDGTNYNKIFKPGRGPGEYVEISAMGANDSVIIIFDNVSRKLMEFDFDGTLIQETKLQEGLWARDIFFFNDNLYFYAGWHESTLGNSRLFALDNITNQVFKSYLPFEEKPIALGNLGPSYSLCNKKASLIYSGCDSVFSISKEGHIAPTYAFDFKGMRAKYPSRRPELVYEENDNDKIVNIDWISETDRYLFASIETVGSEYGFIYDKNEKDYHFYNFARNTNLAEYFIFSAQWIIDNKIVLPESMLNLHHYSTALESGYKLEGFYSQLIEIAENGSIEDNPVVFIFNLKD